MQEKKPQMGSIIREHCSNELVEWSDRMTNHDTRITSAEMAGLWGQYMNDTAAVCVLSYFMTKVKDEQIRSVLELALSSSEEHIQYLKGLFEQEGFPTPAGFTKQDVQLDARPLFSDAFYPQYLKLMSVLGMSASTLALGLASRSDLVIFHKKVLSEAVHLQKVVSDVLLDKGLYVRHPYISTPTDVDFVTKQSFLGNVMGGKRPLTAVEISNLRLNIETNLIGKEMMMAFAQVARRKEVKDYLIRGKQISTKHITVFSDILLDNDIPAAMTWDATPTASTDQTFSDKLIMFHVSAMAAAGVGNYGSAIAASPRKDISLKYSRLLTEIWLYAEDGANIMIDHGWLEKAPQTPDRNQLARGES
ncbi:DUF3231 family protein [Lentibacillus sp. CBA3610]|uniref:DUF3231 family protein n=1 Tax=Lentibacillus sp. CBA3610 TaxID=2518176 RepID=UPI00159548E1|nr:DUF3231 family protein [Lentibacillus sp. CBA3610]QKY68724.1 DUF3231 family protein [Lentibacillus sp. CBA3610]